MDVNDGTSPGCRLRHVLLGIKKIIDRRDVERVNASNHAQVGRSGGKPLIKIEMKESCPMGRKVYEYDRVKISN